MKKSKQIHLPELNEVYQRTLIWFFSFPQREIGLSDLATAIGSSKTTTKIIVEDLVNKEFLKREIIGKLWRLSANNVHDYIYSKKIPYNLGAIYESGILQEVRKHVPSSRVVVLFGSYRKGDDVETSDVDLAAEVLDEDQVEIREVGKINMGYRTNVPVNLHIFSRNKVDLNLFANIANGIVLSGFLEVRP